MEKEPVWTRFLKEPVGTRFLPEDDAPENGANAYEESRLTVEPLMLFADDRAVGAPKEAGGAGSGLLPEIDSSRKLARPSYSSIRICSDLPD